MQKYTLKHLTITLTRTSGMYKWTTTSSLTGWAFTGTSTTKDEALQDALDAIGTVLFQEAKELAKATLGEIYENV